MSELPIADDLELIKNVKFRLSQILKFVMIIYLLGVFTLMILDCISYARIRKADSIADSENPSQFRIVSFSKKKFILKPETVLIHRKFVP